MSAFGAGVGESHGDTLTGTRESPAQFVEALSGWESSGPREVRGVMSGFNGSESHAGGKRN